MGSRISNVNLVYRFIIYFIMLVFTVLTVYPIFWLFIQSFKTNQEYLTTNRLALPEMWFFGNYTFVWLQGGFANFFRNSVFYTIVTVLAVLALANMAGYAFAKINLKITKFLHGMFIIGILLTIQSILIPLFLMVNWTGLYNTRLGVIIPYVGLGLPLAIYLYTDYIRSGIPNELLESARIDGAGPFDIFTRVVVPMCAPVSVTIAIVTFVATWNEFILMNILTAGDALKSIPAAVGRFAGSRGSDYGKVFTSLSISIIPMLVFYFIFRKQITKGVAAGALKG